MSLSRSVFVVLLTAAAVSPSRAEPGLPVASDADWSSLRAHVRRLFKSLETAKAPLPPETDKRLRELLEWEPKDSAAAEEVQKLLDAHCLIGVTINPESRVKALRGPAPAELRCGRETVLLAKILNDAGVTNVLSVAGPQLRIDREAGEGRWLSAAVQTDRPRERTLSGTKVEYVLLRLTAHETGKREATLKFDVGQGTQDLGFRAEVPILFTVGADDR